MIRRVFIYSVTIISFICIAFSCNDDSLQSPTSPINIPNAITFNPDLKYDKVTDIDGNIYKTIIIGKHTWIAENLRVTRFRNGDKIQNIPNKKDWANDDIWGGSGNLGLCAYDNNYNKDSIAKYGLLYGVLAIKDSRCIAPFGWHIATSNEWLELVQNELLTLRGADWVSPFEIDKTSINNSGLTLLPSGARNSKGYYLSRGDYFTAYLGEGRLYEFSINDVWLEGGGQTSRYAGLGYYGFSIRCVKDE